MDLSKITLQEALSSIKNKELKARELVEATLSLIDKQDKNINAFVRVTSDMALQQADAIDKKVVANEPLPPLAGIPVALRDDLCLEGFPASCASKSLEGFPLPYSAYIVDKVIEAGGVVIGKTNLDEFGMGSTTNSSFFGPTHNPLNQTRTAGDGLAAAVQAGFSLLGIGSDTGGVLREGASFCGLHGLRPTSGRISRYGLATFASSMAQTGFLANHPEDLLTPLKIASGYDARDSSTYEYKAKEIFHKNGFPPQSLTAAFPVDLFNDLNEPVRKVLDEARQRLISLGVNIKEVTMPHFIAGLQAYYIIVIGESFSNLSRYDGIRYGYHSKGENLEEWYHKTRQTGLGFEAKRRSILGAFLLNKDNYERYYTRALQVWSLVKEDFASALQDCQLVILPVTSTEAFPLDQEMDFIKAYKLDQFCAPVSLSGLPSLSVPAGKVDGLPLGMQLIGAPFSEEMLVDLACALRNEWDGVK